MAEIKNILFIMFDQLRWDYMSCSGHPNLKTPNFDRLANEGVRFNRAYVQSPVCGPSRMSFYTGRYMQSHGSVWNRVPLKVGELTLGDHMRDIGIDTYLIGKTHMKADESGLRRLGISRNSVIGNRIAECGFDIIERNDGMRPEGPNGLYDEEGVKTYNDWLRSRGYASENPWHDYANASRDEDGEMLSGWFLKNAQKPAAIKEDDSETPYLTGRAIEFLENANEPWCLHLSYMKPHWPYIAPAPYNDMYSVDDALPVVKDEGERENPHPVYEAFMNGRVGQAFSRDEVRNAVVPAYMGLVKQCDDQMGRLFDYLEKTGRFEDTLIVLTSDHGDYLGDHWLGEKDLFHEPSVKIPLIIRDPRTEANKARGTVCDELVEAIDLLPTFLDLKGEETQPHILEGKSLKPFLEGRKVEQWRDYVISEYDYAIRNERARLKTGPMSSRLFMVADKRWKFMHAPGMRPQLFDMKNDPNEFVDLGENPKYNDIITMMHGRLEEWALRLSQRTAYSNDDLESERGRSAQRGVAVGVVNETDIPLPMTQYYRGKPKTKP